MSSASPQADRIPVDPAIQKVFLTEFFAERAQYPDVSTEKIRGAGRQTKAKPNGEDELWWLTAGPQMLQRWENWRDKSAWQIWVTPDGVPAIELPIEVQHRGQKFKVFVDRVFVTESGGLVIVDLKSGARSQESDLQLGIYKAALKLAYDVDVVGGAYWDARAGDVEHVARLPQYTPALAAHYARQLQLARKHKIYLPHVTNMCRACGVREYCVAFGGSKMHFDPDYEFVIGDPEGEENECYD